MAFFFFFASASAVAVVVVAAVVILSLSFSFSAFPSAGWLPGDGRPRPASELAELCCCCCGGGGGFLLLFSVVVVVVVPFQAISCHSSSSSRRRRQCSKEIARAVCFPLSLSCLPKLHLHLPDDERGRHTCVPGRRLSYSILQYNCTTVYKDG